MIHSFLAAFMVTSALIALVVDALQHQSSRLGRAFCWLYLLGTTCWGLVAIAAHSIALVIIAAIQFSCCIFLVFYSSQLDKSR